MYKRWNEFKHHKIKWKFTKTKNSFDSGQPERTAQADLRRYFFCICIRPVFHGDCRIYYFYYLTHFLCRLFYLQKGDENDKYKFLFRDKKLEIDSQSTGKTD